MKSDVTIGFRRTMFVRSNGGGVPLELLVLGSLRYLGRGWTFDDLEEATGISEESHRVFFRRFIS